MRDTDPLFSAGLADWIRLEQTPGVGVDAARKLMLVFGSPAAILGAGYAALRSHVSETVARALCEPPGADLKALLERTSAWLALPNHHLLTLHDPRYPALLAEVADRPLMLYVQGDPAWLSATALAIVGSRNATHQGRQNAEVFAQALGMAGLTIVSGMALGIDAAAHQGALSGPSGTVAVVGTGVDLVYPAANRALAARIAANGCVVSEYALGTPPLAPNFPRRNRIISGLAAGVLVVEAAARSGSLITAHLAAAQGRDVFAIPGSIHAGLSKGCHSLIKEGAKLVESAADVLSELQGAPLLRMAKGAAGDTARRARASSNADADALAARARRVRTADAGLNEVGQQALLEAMGYDPVDIDCLALRAGGETGPLTSVLLALEMGGQLERLPGGLFQRIKS